jgi:hypothetical protein
MSHGVLELMSINRVSRGEERRGKVREIREEIVEYTNTFNSWICTMIQ